MAEVQKIPTGRFHPGYGCAIMAIMVLTFSGIVTWVVYSLLRQDREISGFTVEAARPLPAFAPGDAEKAALRQRLTAFSSGTAAGASAPLGLSPHDCNLTLALATDAGIGGDKDSSPYTDILRVTAFDPSARLIKADLRLPMNKLPWREGRRFLSGTATFRPDIENGSLVIRVADVEVPGKSVSEGFVRNLRNWDWLDIAKKRNPAFDEAMKRIASWRIAADGSALVLERSPAPRSKP